MEQSDQEKSELKKTWWKWARSLCILLLGISAFTGHLEKAVDWCSTPLTQYNKEYLDESLRATTALLIPVTVIKSASDMIEGSTVTGNALVSQVTFEAGDVVKPLLEYTDIAWKILLINFTYLQIALYLSEGGTSISIPILGFSLFFFLIATLPFLKDSNPLRKNLNIFASRFLICAIALLVLLPLMVSMTGFLSSRITRPIQQETQTSFEKLSKNFSLEQMNQEKNVVKKASLLSKKVLYIQLNYKKISKDLVAAISRLVAIRILNGVIFPISSLAFLIWLLRTKGLFAISPDKEEKKP